MQGDFKQGFRFARRQPKTLVSPLIAGSSEAALSMRYRGQRSPEAGICKASATRPNQRYGQMHHVVLGPATPPLTVPAGQPHA